MNEKSHAAAKLAMRTAQELESVQPRTGRKRPGHLLGSLTCQVQGHKELSSWNPEKEQRTLAVIGAQPWNLPPLAPFRDQMPGFPSMAGALARVQEQATESGAVGRLDEMPTPLLYSSRLSGSVSLSLDLPYGK